MPVSVSCSNPKCSRTTVLDDGAAARPTPCPGCGLPLPPPRTIPTVVETVGRFLVRKALGAGAFGTVYRAYDPHLERDVALKVPNAAVLSDPRRVERFIREAKAAANLRHPHIVPVFDAGKENGRYFIAAAFVDGQPLANAVPEGGADFRTAARLARELAEALAYAHGQGVVHRDVKPANAMVDRGGHLHLMDFGLAARADDSAEAKLTNDGAVLGTPAYMAPEQAAGQKGEAQPTADQYSAGVVLYELLTGKPPFEGPPAIVLFNVLNAEPDAPRRRRPSVPADLETVCLKAMAKRPADRYPDCGALADDLRRFLDGEPITARRLSAAERLTRWARKNRAVAALAAAVFVALALGAVASSALAVRAGAQAARARDAEADADRRAAEAETARGEVARQAEELASALASAATKRQEAEAANQEAAKQARLAEDRRAEAEKEKRKAEAERKAADTARQAADEARQAAEKEKLTAQTALADRDRAETDKARSRRETDRLLHVLLFERARAAAERRAYPEADRVLEQCPPAGRGWEWGFLKNAVGQRVIPATPGLFVRSGFSTPNTDAVALDPGGRWAAAVYRLKGERVTLLDRHSGKPTDHLGFTDLPLVGLAVGPDGTVATAHTGGRVFAILPTSQSGFVADPKPPTAPAAAGNPVFLDARTLVFPHPTGQPPAPAESQLGKETFTLHRRRPFAVSDDGEWLVTRDGGVERWDRAARTLAPVPPGGLARPFLLDKVFAQSPPAGGDAPVIKPAPNLAWVAFVTQTGKVMVYHGGDPQAGTREVRGEWLGTPNLLCASPNGERLVFATTLGAVYVADPHTGEFLLALPKPGGAVRSLAFSAKVAELIAAGIDGGQAGVGVWHGRLAALK